VYETNQGPGHYAPIVERHEQCGVGQSDHHGAHDQDVGDQTILFALAGSPVSIEPWISGIAAIWVVPMAPDMCISNVIATCQRTRRAVRVRD
jgi:hypothetical protein